MRGSHRNTVAAARLAHPNTRWFSGFGYAVNKDSSVNEKLDAIYVEFGRQQAPPPHIG